ncbi:MULTISPECIES: cupin domain-containing protein [unclassified Streptomyces]|uniref:cupin domain-containing protein n=1 Tax=unclassified Streptomyces TaxID=2593676 RepID=UPI00234ACE45|nr:cupin domain-containing protein [Streptomyces sp. M92]WCN01648.1 cupin domain-containing protein [Streptomyces sp. M92]
MTVQSENLPLLFSVLASGDLGEADLDFRPLTADGRTNAEIHRLYGPEQTGEGGPAAAVVRYLPGAKAQTHRHPGCELIYVLSGELETEAGIHPAGSLLNMPPGSVHTPRSPKGCLALVVWEQPVQPL